MFTLTWRRIHHFVGLNTVPFPNGNQTLELLGVAAESVRIRLPPSASTPSPSIIASEHTEERFDGEKHTGESLSNLRQASPLFFFEVVMDGDGLERSWAGLCGKQFRYCGTVLTKTLAGGFFGRVDL